MKKYPMRMTRGNMRTPATFWERAIANNEQEEQELRAKGFVKTTSTKYWPKDKKEA